MKLIKLVALLLILAGNSNLFGGLRNLQDLTQDFVLETKQIQIPQYPQSFNPSILKVGDSTLMAFRIRDPLTNSTNQIGFIWLDENFNPIGDLAKLQVNFYIPNTYMQDPRLIAMGDEIYIVYSDIIEGKGATGLRRVFLSKLNIDGQNFSIDFYESILTFPGMKPKRSEKNWAPFVYNDQLYLAYSINPHTIMLPLKGTSQAALYASKSANFKWTWGELRGGTPAFPIDDNHYLAFFHSNKSMATVQSNGQEFPHYFMGAYTFSSQPPFNLTSISPVPIVGKDFYVGPTYKTWKPLRVVFPGGYIFDDQYIWVAYGKQDHEIWIVKLDRKALLESLVPVN